MQRRTLAIASAITLVIVILGALLIARLRPNQQLSNASSAPIIAKARLGAIAPSFSTPTIDGEFNLTTIRKPVFLEVFATWCPHCQFETAVIERLYRRYKSRIAFIALPGSTTNMEYSGPSSQEDVGAFVARFGVNYPVALYDPALTDANLYIQGGFPTIAMIDRAKRIVYLQSGQTKFAPLNKALAQLSR